MGRENFIVHLFKVGADGCELSVVNEIGPLEGQFPQPLLGGVYYFYVDKGPQSGWWIKGECLD